MTKPSITFIIGGPGVGKGTICSYLTNDYPNIISAFSTGDILRSVVKEKKIMGWEKLEYEPGFFCDIINKIDIDVLTECFMEQKYSTKIYQNFIGIFSKRKKIAFRHFKIQTQIEIINDAPKEKKNIYFAILPDEYRTKETLSKIKDIEHEDAEKNLTDKKKDLKKDNKDENTIKIGISREAFKERLKMFDKKK